MDTERMLKIVDFLIREYKFLRRNETFKALNDPRIRAWLQVKKIRRDTVEVFLPFTRKGFVHGTGRKIPSVDQIREDVLKYIKENS